MSLYAKTDELSMEFAVPAAFFTLILGFTWYSSRQTDLKC